MHFVITRATSKKDNENRYNSKANRGLPWWSSGYESTCQCRGHRFNPWSRKIPHAAGQLSLRAATTEARVPGAHAPQQEKPPQWEARAPQLEKACAQQYADDTTVIAESKELKSLLMKVKEESEKAGLELNIQWSCVWHSGRSSDSCFGMRNLLSIAGESRWIL